MKFVVLLEGEGPPRLILVQIDLREFDAFNGAGIAQLAIKTQRLIGLIEPFPDLCRFGEFSVAFEGAAAAPIRLQPITCAAIGGGGSGPILDRFGVTCRGERSAPAIFGLPEASGRGLPGLDE